MVSPSLMASTFIAVSLRRSGLVVAVVLPHLSLMASLHTANAR